MHGIQKHRHCLMDDITQESGAEGRRIMYLETERLILRDYTESDREDYYRLKSRLLKSEWQEFIEKKGCADVSD